jgi:Uma2 family endonuclease
VNIVSQIIPMAGGTPNHNRTAGNFYASLSFALKGQAYDVFIGDMRLWISQTRLYTYPDVMIVSGQLQFAEGRRDTITNPLIIAEVLSESTQNYNQGEKFRLDRTIPSLQEYILIEQLEIHVEQFSKTDNNKWILSEYDNQNALLPLSSIEFQISLLDIYDQVEFDAA